MNIFGIGPTEFLLIFVIALIIFGPKDLAKAGRTIGRILRRLVTSNEWRMLQVTSKEIRQLPTRLMREAGLEELKNLPQDLSRQAGLDKIGSSLSTAPGKVSTLPPDNRQGKSPQFSAWTTSPVIIETPKSDEPYGVPPSSSPNKKESTEDS